MVLHSVYSFIEISRTPDFIDFCVTNCFVRIYACIEKQKGKPNGSRIWTTPYSRKTLEYLPNSNLQNRTYLMNNFAKHHK